jgi:hypothetical protein
VVLFPHGGPKAEFRDTMYFCEVHSFVTSWPWLTMGGSIQKARLPLVSAYLRPWDARVVLVFSANILSWSWGDFVFSEGRIVPFRYCVLDGLTHLYGVV